MNWKDKKDNCPSQKYDQDNDINGRLVTSLQKIGHTMRSLYEGKSSQRRILIILNETGTITQRELTMRLGIQPGSASEVIAKLENLGFIGRSPNEEDRRTTDIFLTEEGKKQADSAFSQRRKRHEEMFSVLSSEEKTQLLFLLDKINEDWKNRYRTRAELHRSGHHHQGEFQEHEKRKYGNGHGFCGGHGRSDRNKCSMEYENGHEYSGKHACSHDCMNCPDPCGRGLAIRNSQ